MKELLISKADDLTFLAMILGLGMVLGAFLTRDLQGLAVPGLVLVCSSLLYGMR